MLFPESDDRFYQRLGDFLVVNEINPSESHFSMIPVPVGNLVDDRHDPAGHLAVPVCQKLGRLAVLTHRILLRIQGGQLIHIEIRNIVGAALIQFKWEFDERAKILPALYTLDSYRHGFWF